MNRDYVVQTHPCSEVIAKSNLEAHGFEVYLPTVIYEGRTGRLRERRYTVEEPLFPGYLFVRLDLAMDAWRKVCAAKGVRRILGHDGEHPTPLPPTALNDLRARFDAGEFVRRPTTLRVIAGDTVTIKTGAFQGHQGRCTMARGERVRVLLSLLSGAIEAIMPAESVMRAAQ